MAKPNGYRQFKHIAQPNRDLFNVMTFGSGDARSQPVYWYITTAGDDPERQSLGWELH